MCGRSAARSSALASPSASADSSGAKRAHSIPPSMPASRTASARRPSVRQRLTFRGGGGRRGDDPVEGRQPDTICDQPTDLVALRIEPTETGGKLPLLGVDVSETGAQSVDGLALRVCRRYLPARPSSAKHAS